MTTDTICALGTFMDVMNHVLQFFGQVFGGLFEDIFDI